MTYWIVFIVESPPWLVELIRELVKLATNIMMSAKLLTYDEL